MALQTKDIGVSGRNTHYIEAGSGDPIILLHGNIGDAAFHWKQIIADLTHEFHVFAPDMPAYGKSEPLHENNFDAAVSWLYQFMTALELEKAVIVGTSYAALVARLFAAKFPDSVTALILINGGSLPPKATAVGKLLAQTPVINNILFGGQSKRMVESREALQWFIQHPKPITNDGNDEEHPSLGKGYTAPDSLTEDMLETAADSAPALAQLLKMEVLSPIPENRTPKNTPTLIMWGEQDEFLPLKVGKNLENIIPDSEFASISETRHAPHIEEADVVAFQIEQFIKNLNKPKKKNLPGAGMLG